MTAPEKDLVTARSRGRPREFDMDEALDKALGVFAVRGYHAASISELTLAMQLASGSVYKAFKDKRAIFLAAFARYRKVRRGKLDAAIADAANGRERLEKTLMFYARAACGTEGRQGCLVVGSATELAILDEEAAAQVAAAFDQNEQLFASFIEEGKADGSIPQHVDVAVTARLMLCVMKGMRLVGKTGRTREEMTAVAAAAMRFLT